MNDPVALLAFASCGTAGMAMVTAAGLKSWQGWLDLRRGEASGTPRRRRSGRPELAELKARVRRLEAIANGGECPPRTGDARSAL